MRETNQQAERSFPTSAGFLLGLDAAKFIQVWNAGKALLPEQAVALALYEN